MGDIAELAKLLNTENGFGKDISETAEFLRQNIMNKYVNKLRIAAEKKRNDAKARPSREVVLLKAIKNYANADASKNIDDVINALNMLQTFKGINDEVYDAYKQTNELRGMSADGEETKFTPNITGALMLLIILGKI